MTFSEKLTGLRRKSGMSQEQLADRLGVTRQSVSKWEGGTAMPELVKLISLSELFGVSVDYLVKDWMEEPDNPCGGSGEISSKQADRLEKKVDELTNYVKGRVYRYDSKTRIFGLPLVSIRFGFVRNGKLSMDNTAKGIIAIGNCAIGVVAIVVLVSIGQGANSSVVESIEGMGTNLITANINARRMNPIDLDSLNELSQNEAISYVAPIASVSGTVTAKNSPAPIS